MARWTVEQVLAAAPDDASRRAAKSLVAPRKWTDRGSTESLVWGKCQGSGATPYQVSVDLTGPAFRCTCPSRKFPCKHGVALLLMWAANDGAVGDHLEASPFADAWAQERAAHDGARQERAAQRAARVADGEDVADPAAQARREAQRTANIDAGLADLERWIGDLLRQGLATARGRPYSFWDQVAARLVDAQAPAVGERVRALGGAVLAREDWLEHLLVELGRLSSVIRAWRQRDALDDAARADLRAVIGWASSSDEVRAGGTIAGQWLVVGRRQVLAERMSTQRTWLWSAERQEWAVVLDFAVGNGALPVTHATGTLLTAAVALYPGSPPRRALLMDATDRGPADDLSAALPLDDALECAARVFAANPWSERAPLALRAVRLDVRPSGCFVRDERDRGLALTPGFEPWRLVALAGREPMTLFGEWDGRLLAPVSAAVAGRVVNL